MKKALLGLSRSQEPLLREVVEHVRKGMPPEAGEFPKTVIQLDEEHAKAEKLATQLLEQGFSEGKDLNQIASEIMQTGGTR